jgi:glycosyltransferase involved in cell wall biosynthesis
MRLAIVIPWFGRELKGGAEQHAWQIATRLTQRGHNLDVLTTCCRSHQDDWATNHLPPGVTVEQEGFTVRRFEVDSRDRTAFDRVCANLLNIPAKNLKPGVSPISPSDAEIFVNELIRSKSLLDYLSAKREEYDWFILLPYLYGPILHAVSILKGNSALLPCLHNEGYAYLPQVAQAFNDASKVLFISEGERELALRLFGPGIWTKSHVVGAGVEVNGGLRLEANDTRNALKTNARFVLYLGRKDAGKNVRLLVRAFKRFRRVRPNSDLRLVLAGHNSIEANGCDHITDLGLVSESEKARLLQDCVAVVQPSANESFSRVIMEAWHYGRPVVAQASCLATATAVKRSGGGWLAETEDDWAELFATMHRTSAKELAELGRKGQRYAKEIANWDKVTGRYEEALTPTTMPPGISGSIITVKQAIHQVLPNLDYGDAISNQALFIRDALRAEGYSSNIYVRYIDPRVAHECIVFTPGKIGDSYGIIYHHSIGTELTPHAIAHRGPKFLLYHNITPAEFFEPYSPDFARILHAGRADLHNLARYFPKSAGDSEFNAAELRACGFSEPMVLPIAVDPAKWSVPPDLGLMERLQDGRTNILFVGRISPQKKQDDLVRAFQRYLVADPSARLILVGPAENGDSYAGYLRGIIGSSGLEESVIIAGSIPDSQLAAYYRTAHLFWSMSEHEGFCVPLVEAMWFDIPIVAYRSTAVPETLGDAALMFADKSDLDAVATLAFLFVQQPDLRYRAIQAQRKRRLCFLPEATRPILRQVLARMLAAKGQLVTPEISNNTAIGALH